MILLDEDEQQRSKRLNDSVAGPTLRIPDRASVAARSSSPLPDYETSQAQHHITFRKPSLGKVDSRFWRATLYALAIYVALSIVIGVPFIVTKRKQSQRQGPPPWDMPLPSSQAMENTGILAMGEAAFCNKWDTFDDRPPHSLFTSSISHIFSPSGSFLIRSNISQDADTRIYGNFSAGVNPDPLIHSVVFLVSMQCSNLEIRRYTNVCFCDDGPDRGVSLYVPSSLTSQDSLSFSVTILFPQTPSPHNFKNLVTFLPLFSQLLGNFQDAASFNSVSLQGAALEIDCDYLQARQISIRNSLSSIIGTFNVTDSLTLDNIGGPILADIQLNHQSSRDPPTVFSLDTGNSEIRANVTLLSSSTNSHPGGFVGIVKTFGAPLALIITHDPTSPPAPLDLRVQNNLADSNVTLDGKYQGFFDLKTKLASVHVIEGTKDGNADPLGEHRNRQIVYDQQTSTRTHGWIGWGKKPNHWEPGRDGRVEIVSSLNPIFLQLGPSGKRD